MGKQISSVSKATCASAPGWEVEGCPSLQTVASANFARRKHVLAPSPSWHWHEENSAAHQFSWLEHYAFVCVSVHGWFVFCTPVCLVHKLHKSHLYSVYIV